MSQNKLCASVSQLSSTCTGGKKTFTSSVSYSLTFKTPRHETDLLKRVRGRRGTRLACVESSAAVAWKARSPSMFLLYFVWGSVCVCVCVVLPIQHSSLAQGEVLTTSGGSTPTLRHNTRATLTVFIWGVEGEREKVRYETRLTSRLFQSFH